MSANIQIRSGRSDERNLVLQSFVREYSGSPFAKDVPLDALGAMMSRIVNAWGFTVAVEPDSDEVLGFVVSQDNAIAWLQVKRPYRGVGIARLLINHVGISTGKVVTPFLPDRELTNAAWDRGYKLTFRPWLALHV